MSGQHQELLEAQGPRTRVLSLGGSPLLESPRELSHVMHPPLAGHCGSVSWACTSHGEDHV